ncbi:MAG: hypothetical protein KHY89_10735 [Butyricicoccus pullicaecorum]|nr:hypothetical protein [Butyricicoccus pullicaecorum]
MIQKVYWDAVHVVIGCMMRDKTEAAQILMTFVSEDFVEDTHRLIFDTAGTLFAAGDAITPITIGAKTSDEIHDLCKSCLNYAPSPRDWLAYVSVIREQAAMFRAAPLAEQLYKDLTAALSLQDVQTQAEQIVGALGVTSKQKNTFTATDLAVKFLQTLDKPVKYLDWGFDKLNRHVLCSGGEYVVIGARPSVGKTAFALQIGLHLARKKRVGFFSLETDWKKVAGRMFTAESMVPLDKIKHHELTADEMKSLAMASTEISKKDFHLIHAAGYTAERIRRETIAGRFEIIFVDYLQLICSSNPKHDDFTRVSETSRQLQMLAKELGVTVIALSQLNRNVDKYTEPDAADLRSSGQIEQDADAILMLYVPPESDLKTPEELAEQDSLRWLKIAKCKEGITGKIRFWFNGEVQRFAQEWEGFYKFPVQEMPAQKPKPPEYEQVTLGGKHA